MFTDPYGKNGTNSVFAWPIEISAGEARFNQRSEPKTQGSSKKKSIEQPNNAGGVPAGCPRSLSGRLQRLACRKVAASEAWRLGESEPEPARREPEPAPRFPRV